jgi:hypothetical protein
MSTATLAGESVNEAVNTQQPTAEPQGAAMSAPTAGESQPDPEFGKKLRNESAAVRLNFSKFGTTRTLSKEQRAKAADPFGAEGDSLRAGKKLLDTKTDEYKAVTEIFGVAAATWKACSYPFPEKGIRLIRRDKIDEFEARMEKTAKDLAAAAKALQGQYEALRADAKSRLGELFNEADYPPSIENQFKIDWDYPSIGAPEYLKQVSPALYAQQAKRIEHQFDDAVAAFEGAMAAELHGMVEHLTERLDGFDDKGKKKTFRDSAVSNIVEFFDRFKSLSIGSSAELDKLVEQCKGLVVGVDPKDLRTNDSHRADFKTKMDEMKKALDDLLIVRPTRKFFTDEAAE